MKKYLPFLIIILGIAGFYYYRYKRAPDLSFSNTEIVTSDGKKTTITSQLTEFSVIHFYASWCGPCIGELNSISKNADMLKSLGIQIICITDDPDDKILRVKEKMPPEIQFYRINNLNDAGIFTLPTTYFLVDGEVIEKQVDVFDWNDRIALEKIKSKKIS